MTKSVFPMANGKAPGGPDGFPGLLFQEFWELVKMDTMTLFLELYNGTLEIKRRIMLMWC